MFGVAHTKAARIKQTIVACLFLFKLEATTSMQPRIGSEKFEAACHTPPGSSTSYLRTCSGVLSSEPNWRFLSLTPKTQVR